MRNTSSLSTVLASSLLLALAATGCAVQPAEGDPEAEAASGSQAMCVWSSSVVGTLSATSSVSATSSPGYTSTNCGWFVAEGDVTAPPLDEGVQLTSTAVVPKPSLLRCSTMHESYVVQGFANGAWSNIASGVAYGALVNPTAPFGSQECVATFTESLSTAQAAPYGAFRIAGSASASANGVTWAPMVQLSVQAWAY